MRQTKWILLLSVAALMLSVAPAFCQVDASHELLRPEPETMRGKLSLGAGAGIFQPIGEWADHRYAPVDQFTTGLALELMLEYQIADWAGIAAVFGGGGLGTHKWVDYALSNGSSITASSRMYYYGGLFRPYLFNRPRYILKLDIGCGGFYSHGDESYMQYNYDYNFLQSVFVFVSGIECCVFVQPKLALAGRIGIIVADGGVDYADGLTRSVTGLPATIGIRFYP